MAPADKPDDEHDQQAAEDQRVLGAVVESLRPHDVAAHECHDDTDDGGQTERVEGQREPQVEIALEDRQPQVCLQQYHGRPERQGQHAPEDKQVHEARVEVRPEAPLQQPVHDEGADPASVRGGE
jgi:hypothetical protein